MITKAFTALIASVIVITGVFPVLTFFVYADSVEYEPITIEGRHRIKGNETIRDGTHTFVLTAKDGAPMPEGSKNGVKKVTIKSNERFSFGKIRYDKPGIYEYTVSREIVKSRNLIQDDSVYNCTVTVFNDGVVTVVFNHRKKKGKPDEIVYIDTFVPDEPPTVKTGDSSDIYVWTGLFITSLALLLMLRKAKKK